MYICIHKTYYIFLFFTCILPCYPCYFSWLPTKLSRASFDRIATIPPCPILPTPPIYSLYTQETQLYKFHLQLKEYEKELIKYESDIKRYFKQREEELNSQNQHTSSFSFPDSVT